MCVCGEGEGGGSWYSIYIQAWNRNETESNSGLAFLLLIFHMQSENRWLIAIIEESIEEISEQKTETKDRKKSWPKRSESREPEPESSSPN